MRAKIFAIALAIAFAASPALASADQISDLQTQVQALLSQLTALQSRPASSASLSQTASCPTFSRTLSRGSRGGDVLALQTLLAAKGALSAGAETGFFGAMTEASVQAFQSSNGIVSSGNAITSGYGAVGPRTQSALASLCSNPVRPAPTSIVPSAPLAANPNSGAAPLAVTFTTGSIVNGSLPSLSIDFGDGSSGQLAIGACTNSIPGSCAYSATHTYASAGTYAAQLANGAASAAVTVSSGATSVYSGTLSATPLSGTAPLTVSFSWANASPCGAGQICGNPQPTISFGDGASGTLQAACTNSIPGSCSYGATHTYASAGTYVAQALVNGSPAGSVTVTVSSAAAMPATLSLNATPSSGIAPLSVTFSTNAASGAIDFGDGSSGSISAYACTNSIPGSCAYGAAHAYAAAGTYAARLLSSNSSASATVTVSSAPPIATATPVSAAPAATLGFVSPGANVSITQGQGMPIAWTSQNAPSGEEMDLYLAYPNGTRAGYLNNTTGAGWSPTGIFSWNGLYCPISGCNGSPTPPPTGQYVIAGALSHFSSACASFSCAGLTSVTDAQASSNAFAVTQAAPAILGTLSASPSSGPKPLTVSFSWTSSGSCGAGQICSVPQPTINFGDGTTGTLETACTNSIGGSCSNGATHAYAASGSYTAQAFINGSAAGSATISVLP